MRVALRILIVIVALPFLYMVSCSIENYSTSGKFNKARINDSYSKIQESWGKPDRMNTNTDDGKFWVSYYDMLGPNKYIFSFDKDSLLIEKYTD